MEKKRGGRLGRHDETGLGISTMFQRLEVGRLLLVPLRHRRLVRLTFQEEWFYNTAVLFTGAKMRTGYSSLGNNTSDSESTAAHTFRHRPISISRRLSSRRSGLTACCHCAIWLAERPLAAAGGTGPRQTPSQGLSSPANCLASSEVGA